MKNIILIISIVITAALSGCISWPEADTVLIETDISGDASTLLVPDDLQYFDTMEEAILHNDMDLLNLNIDGIIKLFENDEYAVLFCREKAGDNAGNDAVSVFKFVVKTDGNRIYSTPVAVNRKPWDGHKLFVKRAKLDEIGEVRLCISRDSLRLFKVDDTKDFFWGLSQTERARNLKIEGQPVSEVIEVELDGETWYFWYFEDLQTDKRPLFKDIREYTEDEFIITMDQ